MVNKGKILMEKLQKDLNLRLSQANTNLVSLQSAIQDVLQVEKSAKANLDFFFENVDRLLQVRKAEAMREIELECGSSLNDLHETFKDTCMAIGNIQSTLRTLNCLGYDELLSLEVPEVSSASVQNDFQIPIFNHDMELVEELVNKLGRTKTGEQSSLGFHRNRNLGLGGFKEAHENEIPMEHWLLSAGENEVETEFELVSLEDFSGSKNSSINSPISRPELKLSAQPSEVKTAIKIDTSEWLVTKDTGNQINSHDPSANRFIEFPCLKTSPEVWLKSDTQTLGPKNDAKVKVFLPPEFNFPSNYWLR